MTRDETLKILSVLKAAFPHSYKDMTKRDANAMVDLWTMAFSGEPYEVVNAAVVALIVTRTTGFSPTIGEVKAKLAAPKAAQELSEQSAWALVSKACENGLYGYQKEFAKLPPEVQRAVGAPEQLKAWAAMDAETVQSVVASNFMRNYRTQQTRAQEMEALPPAVREMLSGVASSMTMIGDGGDTE